MSFSLLSLPWVLGGLAALAAILYALQLLRVRHRTIVVPTTLFWRAAVEESPARTFRERFRHPWAYVLFLVIAALLWLAFAGLELRREADDTFHVLVLDGSAGMSAGNRYESAVAALKQRLQSLPLAQRQVLWSGGDTRTLLNPGEHELLLDRRLAGLAPVAAPAGVESLLRSLAASPRAGRSTHVTVFGDAPIRAEVLQLVPSLRVVRARTADASVSNAGVTALGVADAASGSWNRVDVFLRVDRRGAKNSDALPEILLDDVPIAAAQIEPVQGDNTPGLVVRDVPAGGGLLTVKLAEADDIAADNIAQIRLPDRPRMRVLLSPSLAPALRPVLEADPAVELVAMDAALVIRRTGESMGGTLPALEFGPSADRPAFAITHPGELDSTDVLNHAVSAIGLREIDAMALAGTAQREIGVSIAPGDNWRFEVWEELLSEEFNFTSSRSFPLFMANAIRWLGKLEPGHPVAAAGRPLTAVHFATPVRVVGTDGRIVDTLGAPYVPEQAGELRTQNAAKPIVVSLLDPTSTLGATGPRSGEADLEISGASPGNPIAWLLLGAFVLLALEWYLLQSGRVP